MRWHVSENSSSLHRFANQIFLTFPSSSSFVLWFSQVLFRVFPCRSGESGNRKLRWDQTRLTGDPPAPTEAAAPPLAADRSSLASRCSASACRHFPGTPRHDSRHRQASRSVLQTGTPVRRLCSSSESAARSHPEEEQHPFSGDPSCCWKYSSSSTRSVFDDRRGGRRGAHRFSYWHSWQPAGRLPSWPSQAVRANSVNQERTYSLKFELPAFRLAQKVCLWLCSVKMGFTLRLRERKYWKGGRCEEKSEMENSLGCLCKIIFLVFTWRSFFKSFSSALVNC